MQFMPDNFYCMFIYLFVAPSLPIHCMYAKTQLASITVLRMQQVQAVKYVKLKPCLFVPRTAPSSKLWFSKKVVYNLLMMQQTSLHSATKRMHGFCCHLQSGLPLKIVTLLRGGLPPHLLFLSLHPLSVLCVVFHPSSFTCKSTILRSIDTHVAAWISIFNPHCTMQKAQVWQWSKFAVVPVCPMTALP